MIANAGSVAGFRVGESQFVAYGSTATGTFFGINKANNAFLMDYNGQYTLSVGTLGATPLVFGTNNAEVMRINSSGNIGIGTSSPTYKLEVVGSFGATTKSFVINHPTKSGKKLQHGVVEGPEHSVFVRGKTTSNTITLPEYWSGLVHEDTITVHLTSIGKHQNLVVTYVDIHEIKIENQNSWNTNINCYYIVQAERKDIPKLVVEY